MDPNSNLLEQDRILGRLDAGWDGSPEDLQARTALLHRLQDLREALRGWLVGDGFEPAWRSYPRAKRSWDNWRVTRYSPE